MILTHVFLVFSSFVVVILLPSQSRAISKHPIVLITAFDGYGYDFMDRKLTPVLEQLAQNGTTVDHMSNVFPTVTSPNFFSISTGLYPETHGVLANVAFDEYGTCLNNGPNDTYRLFHYNEDIIPLWVLNEISGDERYSGTIYWPSSRYAYHDRLPTFALHDNTTDFAARVDTAIRWITDVKTPANLVFLYFGQPDAANHEYGPDSEPVNEMLRYLNNVTEYLLQRLDEHNLKEHVNLVFLSDHGAVNLPAENIIPMDTFVSNETYASCGESPVWQIRWKPGYEQEVYANFTKAAAETGTFTVYKYQDIPERWHFKKCNRTADLLLVANLTYGFPDAKQYKGDHGYDPQHLKVRPFFLANGPLFKVNYKAKPFNNIDIYPLVQQVLGLQSPSEHVKPNGTVSIIRDILRNETQVTPP